MTKLYLIRHAEAEGNIFRRMHGQYNSSVTRNGLRQIEALRERFESVPVDAVYASDLLRTRKTAEAICLPKALPLRPDPRFRELSVGIWEDLPFGELEHSFPRELDCFLRDPEHWLVPGAESWAHCSTRFAAGLQELAEAHSGKTLAIFTHGCILSGGLHRILGLPRDSAGMDNASVSLLNYENGSFTAAYLFDNSHLCEAISTRARQRWWRQQGGKFNLRFRPPLPGDEALWEPACLPFEGDRLWVALLEQTPVGWVSLRAKTLSGLYLRPEFRHRRMGDQLYGQAVSQLRAEGVDSMNIGVPTVNFEAVAFFSHHCGNPVQMDDIYTVFHAEIALPPIPPEAVRSP